VSPISPPERLLALPRALLVGPPTPVQRLERFERAISSKAAIFMKRDDAIPFGFGGNKVRKLEFVLGAALREGKNTVITCGGVQSNHCRATAAAAARLGLSCHLVLSGGRPEVITGNTRLDELYGAKLHFVADRAERAPAMEALAASLSGEGRSPLIIPLGASTPLGALGFTLAIFEMIGQGQRPDLIVHASSSGGTQGGLLAGLALTGLTPRVVGVSADESAPALREVVETIERGVLELLGSDTRILDAEVQDGFVGEGYGLATKASFEAQTLLARSEAIVVDHTYTAKALAGLIALLRGGAVKDGGSVLFWHTGGQVGVLA
jgi:1-aminocyclopropane-1-carboxylate deaminase/D-cysteine desulfhydrase-like pyridoxal-dependent ACC family enzyme